MTTRRYSFINKSGEVYPAFGCGRLKTILEVDTAGSQPIYELVKPDGIAGIYIINGPNNVANNKPGVGLALIDAFLVLVDDGTGGGEPAFGSVCGPESGRWAATTAGDGLRASGETANRLMPVIPLAVSEGGAAVERCPCSCIPAGDVLVRGIETTMLWTIKMNSETFYQEFGSINFPAGEYNVAKNPAEDEWTLDIGDFLTASYESGANATEDTTLSGTLTMSFNAYGGVQVQLCVDGEVPEEA